MEKSLTVVRELLEVKEKVQYVWVPLENDQENGYEAAASARYFSGKENCDQVPLNFVIRGSH